MTPPDAMRHQQKGRSRALRLDFNNLAVDIRIVKTYHRLCPMPIRARARAVSPLDSPPQLYINYKERPAGTNSDIGDGVGGSGPSKYVTAMMMNPHYGAVFYDIRLLITAWHPDPRPQRPRPTQLPRRGTP